MTSKASVLDDGVKFDGSDEEQVAWRDAFYGALLGSDRIDGGVGFGSYFIRVPTTLIGIDVDDDIGYTPLPGAILSVQVTSGANTGVYPIRTIGSVTAGEVLVANSVGGLESMQFHEDDEVTKVAVRYISMPQEMFTALTFDPDAPE